MKSKGNLTKEIFCGDEGRDERSQNKRDHESNGKMTQEIEEENNDEQERRKGRANNRKELEAMPMHLPQ
jgi:hypothetical protein